MEGRGGKAGAALPGAAGGFLLSLRVKSSSVWVSMWEGNTGMELFEAPQGSFTLLPARGGVSGINCGVLSCNPDLKKGIFFFVWEEDGSNQAVLLVENFFRRKRKGQG